MSRCLQSNLSEVQGNQMICFPSFHCCYFLDIHMGYVTQGLVQSQEEQRAMQTCLTLRDSSQGKQNLHFPGSAPWAKASYSNSPDFPEHNSLKKTHMFAATLIILRETELSLAWLNPCAGKQWVCCVVASRVAAKMWHLWVGMAMSRIRGCISAPLGAVICKSHSSSWHWHDASFCMGECFWNKNETIVFAITYLSCRLSFWRNN